MNTQELSVTLVASSNELVDRFQRLQNTCIIHVRAIAEAIVEKDSEKGRILAIQLPSDSEDTNRYVLDAVAAAPHDLIIGVTLSPANQDVSRWIRAGLFELVDMQDSDQVIMESLHHAHKCSRLLNSIFGEYIELRKCFESITPVERQVLDMVFEGVPNKVIAKKLDVTLRTIEFRRRRIFDKIHARSLPELVRSIDRHDLLRNFFEGLSGTCVCHHQLELLLSVGPRRRNPPDDSSWMSN